MLTCFPYITGLGFYGDDWGVLGVFGSLTDHFFGRLFSLLAHHHLGLSRPGQMLYMALQYKVFGFQPIGYHVVNTAVLALGAILFYLTLRQLGQDRLIALSVGLVFSLLPHFSTTRFWYAASQGNLSLAFYFLSLYSDLRMLKANYLRRWLWKGIGWVSLLGSVLCYESVLPLFLLNPLLVWHRRRQLEVASRMDQGQSSTGLPVALLSIKGWGMMSTAISTLGYTLIAACYCCILLLAVLSDEGRVARVFRVRWLRWLGALAPRARKLVALLTLAVLSTAAMGAETELVKLRNVPFTDVQIQDSFWNRLPAEALTEVFGEENFIRVHDETGAELPEDDLFAGLR